MSSRMKKEYKEGKSKIRYDPCVLKVRGKRNTDKENVKKVVKERLRIRIVGSSKDQEKREFLKEWSLIANDAENSRSLDIVV